MDIRGFRTYSKYAPDYYALIQNNDEFRREVNTQMENFTLSIFIKMLKII